jgi:hypothetical protein
VPAASAPGASDPSASGPAIDARTRKRRQAAFVYLHVALLYEFVVFVLWRQGLLPESRGPGWVWLLAGAAITAAVVAGLWYWRNVWFARAIWALHALRLPALIGGAFFPPPDAVIPPGLWAMAIPIVLVNLWMLARAGWDL